MKKTSKSRMKKLPILLGTLLIISVAAYGTRAYFSDSASQQGNIKLTLGTVDIAPAAEEWKYTPVATGKVTEEKNENIGAIVKTDGSITDAQNITKVRPGDSFTREYTFENKGSLNVKLKLDENSFQGDKKAFVTKIDASADNTTIKVGESATYAVTITVPDLDNASYNNKDSNLDSDELAVDYLGNSITVEAFQTNAETSTPAE